MVCDVLGVRGVVCVCVVLSCVVYVGTCACASGGVALAGGGRTDGSTCFASRVLQRRCRPLGRDGGRGRGAPMLGNNIPLSVA